MPERLVRFLPRAADYDRSTVRVDALAGLTVAVVALPLALGFGITSGAGAAAGLYTAIVAGVLAAAFGGSRFQVSGPTGAMTVVLLPIVARHGPEALAPIGLLAGSILIVLGAAGVGRVMRYVPFPVVTGFTIGIAIIIFLQQLPGFLGVEPVRGEQVLGTSARVVMNAVTGGSLEAPMLGAITVAVMVGWGRARRLRGMPASMAALVIGTSVSLLPTFAGVPRVSAIPTGLPSPGLPGLAGLALSDLVRAALIVAALSALESLLSAVVADGMTISERHDPDRELVGQGIANVGAALLGGIPATAALARTATNVHAGARTRLSAIVHGLTLLVIVLVAAPLASRIPLTVLSAILMVVAVRMVDREEFRLVRRTTRTDAFTMIATLTITVVFDLILALEVGLIAAAGLFVVRMSNLLEVDPAVVAGDPSPVPEGAPARQAEADVRRDDIVVFRIEGPVFFGAADRFFEELLQVDHGIRAVVLRMRGVPVMDVTGAAAMRTLIGRLTRRGVLVLVSAVRDQPLQVLERSGVLADLAAAGGSLFPDSDAAIAHARAVLSGRGSAVVPDHREDDDPQASSGSSRPVA